MYGDIRKVNLEEKFDLIHEHWRPKIVGELNNSYVKVVKMKGEFVWHYHEAEDEVFLVRKGELTIRLKDRDIRLKEGELVIIPKGIEHKPVAANEVEVILLEPKTTLNTGNIRNEKTAIAEWI